MILKATPYVQDIFKSTEVDCALLIISLEIGSVISVVGWGDSFMD